MGRRDEIEKGEKGVWEKIRTTEWAFSVSIGRILRWSKEEEEEEE